MADTKPILYGPDGQPISRAVLTTEVAGPTITGVRSPLTGYPGDGLNPRRLAALLREADQGEPLRYLELAEQIEERDLHYAGVLGTRKRSVAQLEIQVDAAGNDDASVKMANLVRDWLLRDELQSELFDILDAIGKGWSFTEIIWDSSEGQHWPARLEWRDPRWFKPRREDGVTPQMLKEDGTLDDLPACKFVCAVIRAKSGLPIRSGIARLATWSWMFKAFTLRDWAIFTQTFGQPIRVGKYGAGATEGDKDTLFRAVANIAGDCAAIVPEGMSIEFIEGKNISGSLDLYLKRADWLDQQVSKAVLGQTATTDAVTGGLGSGKEHRQVQEDIERADAKALSAIINRDLVRPFVAFNFGPQKKYPRLRIGRAEDRDIQQLTDSVVKLVPYGLRVEASWMNDQLGIPDADKTAVLLTAPAAPASFFPPATQSQQAAGTKNDEVDALATAAENVAQGGTDAMIDYIRGLVDGATSLQAVQDSLLKHKPDMPQAQLARLMQIALAMAELSGRADIADVH